MDDWQDGSGLDGLLVQCNALNDFVPVLQIHEIDTPDTRTEDLLLIQLIVDFLWIRLVLFARLYALLLLLAIDFRELEQALSHVLRGWRVAGIICFGNGLMLVAILDTGGSKVPLLHPEDDDAPGNNLE